MKAHPKKTGLLYAQDIFYIRLNPRQKWDVTKEKDSYNISYGPATFVIDHDTFEKHFEVEE